MGLKLLLFYSFNRQAQYMIDEINSFKKAIVI